MAKDTEELTEMLTPSGGEGPKSGGRKVRDRTQSADEGIEATDYTYTPADHLGFNIETTADNSESAARKAVELAKGDGADDGISEPGEGESY